MAIQTAQINGFLTAVWKFIKKVHTYLNEEQMEDHRLRFMGFTSIFVGAMSYAFSLYLIHNMMEAPIEAYPLPLAKAYVHSVMAGCIAHMCGTITFGLYATGESLKKRINSFTVRFCFVTVIFATIYSCTKALGVSLLSESESDDLSESDDFRRWMKSMVYSALRAWLVVAGLAMLVYVCRRVVIFCRC